MTDNHALRGPKLKIKRARELIDEILAETESFFSGNKSTFVIEPEPETGNRIAKLKLVPELPERLLMLVPEAIYHLRSNLDQTVVAIGRQVGHL